MLPVLLFLYAALLFFVLSPGVLLRLPRKGSKMLVAGVHAVVFAFVWVLTAGFVYHLKIGKLEGMTSKGEDVKKSFQKLSKADQAELMEMLSKEHQKAVEKKEVTAVAKKELEAEKKEPPKQLMPLMEKK